MSYYRKLALFNNNEESLSNIRSAITYCVRASEEMGGLLTSMQPSHRLQPSQ